VAIQSEHFVTTPESRARNFGLCSFNVWIFLISSIYASLTRMYVGRPIRTSRGPMYFKREFSGE